MPRKKSKPLSALPSKADILEFIQNSPDRVGKREIARAFRVKGSDRQALKDMLRELENDGSIERNANRKFSESGRLSEVAVVEAVRIDADGELTARPVSWEEPEPPPLIFVRSTKASSRAIGVGDRILARLKPVGDGTYEAQTIRKLKGGARQILGVCERHSQGGFLLRPIDRRERQTIVISKSESKGAKPGELVLVEVAGSGRAGRSRGQVIDRVHDANITKALSLIAIHSHGLPHEWSAAVLNEAERSGPVKLGKRDDLRDIPLVTIDGEDARDFDDAVWAKLDTKADNKDGWHIVVAIADVSWYVRPGSALDKAAYERGNSTYFPDRVVPMLPEALSNGWCSLKPAEDRPCMAVHLWIDRNGVLKRHKFVRALMRSADRLTYSQVQEAFDGHPDATTTALLDPVVKPLYGAFACLEKARRKRGALELDIPERKIDLDDDGRMTGVTPRPRLASHQLIEEFMILANVAAANTLQQKKAPGLYRVHEAPDPERINDLRLTLQSMDLNLTPAGSLKAKMFNRVLEAVRGDATEQLINMLILRAQSQARYEAVNLGHFSLSLGQYTHFTSPIRRYSDLIVHRALITTLKLGQGGFKEAHAPDLNDIADHISATERRSVAAERETIDRFTAAFLEDRVDAEFSGTISGVSRFGVFVTLTDTGADGLLPIKRLPNDFYDVFEDRHALCGRATGKVFAVGDPMTVKLVEAEAISGSLIFDFLDHTALRDKSTLRPPGRPRRPKKRGRSPPSTRTKRGKIGHQFN